MLENVALYDIIYILPIKAYRNEEIFINQTKKSSATRNLSQVHFVLLIVFIVIVVVCIACCKLFTENQKLTKENELIQIENVEMYNQLKILTHKISDMRITIDNLQALKQDINEEIVEEVNLYDGISPLYTFLYDDMRVDKVDYKEITEKTVYLTFDDGPSYLTSQILDILAKDDIKATFFVQGASLNSVENIAILQRIYNEGHSIGVHTDTHIYNEVYSSMESFLKDYYAIWEKIYRITGEKTAIYRFPGGSSNNYSKKIIEQIKAELDSRGFVYYDWNVSADDSVPEGSTLTSIIANATKSKGFTQAVVLMHDTSVKTNTVQALPEIIEYYKNNGYIFDKLSENIPPVQF